ncbi:MAG: helix-turn-helix transcriptional regulator [Treponema sp.]|nr:helix-turn-helix transcriptional regulator [Treponema sp.]
MSYQKDFIANLKYYRSQKGYSQAKLAEACNCQPGTIGCIECGRQFPSFELLFKISDVLEINPADLFLRNASNSLFETRKIMQDEFVAYVENFVKEKF